MGDCLYLRAPDIQSEEPRLLVLSSESWMHPEAVGALLGKEHWINTTTGVWLYSTDLRNDRAAVVARLRSMADLVEPPEFEELHAKAPRSAVHRRRPVTRT